MNVQSEKAIYDQEVREALRNINADTVIWGEDLYNASIVVYANSLKQLIGNKSVYNSFANAELVFFNFDSDHYIRHTAVKWDEERKTVFLSVGNFDGCWRYLKHSVRIGLRIHKGESEVEGIDSPTDIVDLYNLRTDRRDAYIKNDRINYKSIPIPQEVLRLHGKKQSILDNPKNRFFYSKNGGYYHVKDCEAVKTISPEVFCGSKDIPENCSPCFKCERRIFLRVACDPYVKQIPAIDRMLRQRNVATRNLEKYVFTYGLKFHLDEDGDLLVKGEEDTWIIKGFDDELLSLWHNNYVKTAPRERYITTDFHDQKVRRKNIDKLFDYIHCYSFERHLEGEERAAEIEMKKAAEASSNDMQTPLVTEKMPKSGRSLVKRFLGVFKRLFKKN